VADAFVSTYDTSAGPRLAAMIVDASDALRDREEGTLDQVMAGSRILVSSLSHEYRNVGGAIGVAYQNLARSGLLKGNQDFEALGALVGTLRHIAAFELNQTKSESPVGPVDIADVLADLRIVLDPLCRESEIDLRWNIPPGLPLVIADRHRLVQVLLNLTRNSERALRNADRKELEISAETSGDHVAIRVRDSGPGIPDPARLFQPLQKGAAGTGLGLYLSRAFVRSFGGDLRHEASPASNSIQNVSAPAVISAPAVMSAPAVISAP